MGRQQKRQAPERRAGGGGDNRGRAVKRPQKVKSRPPPDESQQSIERPKRRGVAAGGRGGGGGRRDDDGGQAGGRRTRMARLKLKKLLNTLVESREGPEMFPRIFAVSILWIVVFGFVIGYMWVETQLLNPMKSAVGLSSDEGDCFAQVDLVRTIGDCCALEQDYNAKQNPNGT